MTFTIILIDPCLGGLDHDHDHDLIHSCLCSFLFLVLSPPESTFDCTLVCISRSQHGHTLSPRIMAMEANSMCASDLPLPESIHFSTVLFNLQGIQVITPISKSHIEVYSPDIAQA